MSEAITSPQVEIPVSNYLPTKNELLTDTPLILIGSEVYKHYDTMDKISRIIAYNKISEKKLNYDSKMKPLGKNGDQKSKFYPLTTIELKICTDEANKIVSSINAEDSKKEAQIETAKEQFRTKKLEDEQAEREEILAESEALLKSGKFIDYAKTAFGKIWYRDQHVLEAILYQSGAARLKNPDDGIHIFVDGDTQIGKSDSVKTGLKFVHPDDRLNKKFTKAWIYYTKQIHSKTILFSDDTTMDPEEAEFFRAILTSWITGCERGVVKNQEEMNQTIPKRVSLILTSVESVAKESDEGQDESRFLTVNVRRTLEDEEAIRLFFQTPHPSIDKELKIIYGVWEVIGEEQIEVSLHRIFNEKMPFREFKRYLTMLKVHAMLSGRTTTTEEDVDAIKKFLSNTTPMIDSTTAGFTRNEEVVHELLSFDKWTDIKSIQDATGMKYLNVARALRGSKGSFSSPTNGLLVKAKIQQRTIKDDHENTIHEFRKFKGGSDVQKGLT